MKRAALRTLIVDDEPLAIERLVMLLDGRDDVTIVGTAPSGAAALELFEECSPELCLLDIAMPGLSGMDVARQLAARERSPTIVFVTAFDTFAVAAFDIDVADYLMKPVDPERLDRALDRVRRHVTVERRGADPIGDFWVSQPNGLVRVAASDVDRITAERDYMRLHVGARSWLINDSMGRLEQCLDPRMFVRLHRGAIVNTRTISGLRRDENGWVARLSDGSEQKVGRSYLDNLRDWRARRGR